MDRFPAGHWLTMTPNQPTTDANAIWHAAVKSVHATELVRHSVRATADKITFSARNQQVEFQRDLIHRICVVGAGKAAAAMAIGLEHVLLEFVPKDRVSGIVNTTDEQAVELERELSSIQLRGVRPAGDNSPRERTVTATHEIINLVAGLQANDLCIVLLSGGGSAMLSAPVPPITVQEKSQLAQKMFSRGGNILQVNRVRQHLSDVKGGGLLRECRAGNLLTLTISDVIGNPLDIIASGPTIPATGDPADAIKILRQFELWDETPKSIKQRLEQEIVTTPTATEQHLVLADNTTAVMAAAAHAAKLGYKNEIQLATTEPLDANQLGQQLADRINTLMRTATTDNYCLTMGSETTVRICDSPGIGGRNQQIVLSALANLDQELIKRSTAEFCILSGGTDGEDGPTQFAGAWIDNETAIKAFQRDDLTRSLEKNDSNTFLKSFNCLLKTGPTGTNVCDVQVVTFVQKSAID